MMKRIRWFAGGVVAGAAGSVVAGKKIKRKAEQLKPVNVARSAVLKAKDKVHDLSEALREGRDAMHEKEAELKALRDVGVDDLGDAAVVPVQPGQVIVLKSVGGPERRRRRA